MKRYDGLYGKLVKDWGLDEWTKFYCEHYVGFALDNEDETTPQMRRMFCGPYFTDDELSKYINLPFDEFVEVFDVPLMYLPPEKIPDHLETWEEISAARDEYRKTYPLPIVATHFSNRLSELEAEAIEDSFNTQIQVEIQQMNESEARIDIGCNLESEQRAWEGRVTMARNAREYAYLVARYPNLRHKNCDKRWVKKEGYARFYQQYVDHFAKEAA